MDICWQWRCSFMAKSINSLKITMLNTLSEALTLDSAGTIASLILAAITIGGVFIGIGKLISVISALGSAVRAATSAIQDAAKSIAEHDTDIALLKAADEGHDKNIELLWDKWNKASESGAFASMGKKK